MAELARVLAELLEGVDAGLPVTSVGPNYWDALVMTNAQLFRALLNAASNNAQIIGADNGRPRANIDHIITQLFS